MSIVPPSPSLVISVESVSASAAAATGSAAAAGASAAASAGNAETGMSTDELMVYWLDIALLCVVGVFFLAGLPRLFGRFLRASEWTRGNFLRGGSSGARSAAPARPISPAELLRRQYPNVSFADVSSSQSHTFAVHDDFSYAMGGKEAVPPLPFTGRNNPPPHVPALSTVLHPISSVFTYSVAPGKSVGKLTLLVLFLAACIVITFLKDGNPLADAVRLGWISTALIPVAIALGTKNNLVGMLVGMGYERLNFLHRWVGIVSFATANLHAVGYIYKWAIKGALSEEFAKPFIIYGTISLGGAELLYFASLGFIRHRAYTFFLFSHIVGNAMFLVALCFHVDGSIKYVVIGAAIYGLDHLMRIVKTRMTTARVKAVPELGLVQLELPGLKAGWRAGQHVRLRVLSTEMGWIGWSVAHPFTVANASNSNADRGLVLLVKKAGSWTNNLYSAADRSGQYVSDNGFGMQRDMRVIVEGPYGGLGNMVMTSFSAAMLVTGGSGVTFALSQAEELVQAVRGGRSALKLIEIVWITQDQASINPLVSTFSALIGAVAPVPGVLLKISVFYSRASAKPVEKDSSSAAYVESLAPNLSVHAGRPMLPYMLDSVVRLTSSLQHARGVAVGVCGPIELVEDVQRAGRAVNSDLRNACGGVEVHEETFGW